MAQLTQIASKSPDASRAAAMIDAVAYAFSRSPLGCAYLSVLSSIEWCISDEALTVSHKGSVARVNPDWFTQLPVAERAYWVLHVTAHVVMSHTILYRDLLAGLSDKSTDNASIPQARMEAFAKKNAFNYALDLVVDNLLLEDIPEINAYLAANTPAKFRCMTPTLPDFMKGKEGWDALAIFDFLMKNAESPPQSSDEHEANDEEGEGEGTGGSDETTSMQQQKEQAQDVQRMLDSFSSQRSMGKTAQGDLPTNRPLFSATVQDLPWQRILAPLLRSAVSRSSSNPTWTKINNRAAGNNLLLPGRRPDPVVNGLVVTIDTSGSIQDNEVAEFATHLTDMLEATKPASCTVLWVDDEVRLVQEFKPSEYGNIRSLLKPSGGGGTDMVAAMRWIKANAKTKPVGLIVFTDGYTPFPDKTEGYPIWWVCNTHAFIPASAGTAIRFSSQNSY